MRTPILMFVLVLAVGIGCNGDDDCNTASEAMEKQLAEACNSDVYKDSPFCKVCVPHGFYSIDDLCNCRPLTFDADFCAFEVSPRGTEKIGAALDYARSVCQGGACLPKDSTDERCPDANTSSGTTASSGGGGAGGVGAGSTSGGGGTGG